MIYDDIVQDDIVKRIMKSRENKRINLSINEKSIVKRRMVERKWNNYDTHPPASASRAFTRPYPPLVL
jgi:hypothetical protein